MAVSEFRKAVVKMKTLENKCMLITYSDSMGHNLMDLERVLSTYFKDAVGGVHILPFFPSSGDRGFAPMDYTRVDPSFGGWEDVEKLADKYYLMFDYMINHISAQSEYYKDFLEKKDASRYRDLFIRYKDFWEGGEPTQEQVDVIRENREPLMWTLTSRTGPWKRYGAPSMRSRLILTANQKLQKNLSGITSQGCAGTARQ